MLLNELLPDWVINLLYIALIAFVIGTLVKIFRGGLLPRYAYGNWVYLVKNISDSSQDFYNKFEKNLKESKVSDIQYSWENMYEGAYGVSLKRRYRRIEWKDKLFYICVAPFGNGFFISWWHFEKSPLWKRIMYMFPGGEWFAMAISPQTFYRLDSAAVFQKYMQDSVTEALVQIGNTHNITLEIKDNPQFKGFYKR